MADKSMSQSSLASYAKRFSETSKESSVSIREVPMLQQVDLRGDFSDPESAAACETTLGYALPETSCSVATGAGNKKALWLGPDEWLVLSPEASDPPLAAVLGRALDGQHVSVVDVSRNRLIIELTGPRSRDVLEKSCLLDLHPRAFASGSVVGTVMHKTQVFLEQLDDQPTYWIYVRPSFSRHLAELLLDAMVEYESA